MPIRDLWRAWEARRARRFLRQHADSALAVLRQDPSLAAEALTQMYRGDQAFVNRINELEAAQGAPQRESFAYPVLTQLGFGGRQPLQRTVPKITSWSLRRFAELPPARRAINAIKNPILDLPFDICLRKSVSRGTHTPATAPTEDQYRRIVAATEMLMRPNDEYSGREFLDMLLDDILTFGAGSFENQRNKSDARPLFLWAVDAQSIRINTAWRPRSAEGRYSQARGYLLGTGGASDDVWLRDEELCYLKYNARAYTPFGLGPLEVAFGTVNAFLGSFEYAERRASNSTPNYLIFLGENVTPDQVQRFRHYWENEIEGFGKVPIMGGSRSPSVQPFTQDQGDPLYLRWQEWLTRIIFMAFGLSPLQGGLERDINRSTAEVQQAQDWSSIAPIAHTLREAFTQWLLWKRLGWTDLEFTWRVRTADELKQATIVAEQWNADAIYVDEIRALYDRPPLPDGLGQLTKTAYTHAIKSGMRGDTDRDVTPLDDVSEGLLAPHERAFLHALQREQRRAAVTT